MTKERAIDLCQAIDKYLCAGNPIWDVEEIHDAMSTAIEALKAQSITLDNISNAYENGYQQGKFEALQWIPVSDHLPDKDFTDCLVQIGHGEYALYETAYRVRGRWVFYSDRQDGEGQSVIAWMECPSPYTEEEQ